MALEKITFNLGALDDAANSGKNYVSGQVFEVFNIDDTYADIFADSAGTIPIDQSGIQNISNSDGECKFFIDKGFYNIKSGGKARQLNANFSFEFETVSDAINARFISLLEGRRVFVVDRGAYFNVVLSSSFSGGNAVDKDEITSVADDNYGFKLEPQIYYGLKMLGGANDGISDDIDYLDRADELAKTHEVPCIIGGDIKTSRTFNVNCQKLTTIDAKIIKTLDNTEVVRFMGAIGGGDGLFRHHDGVLLARQDQPPISTLEDDYSSAHAFVFEDVVGAIFGKVRGYNCAYAFFNDKTSPHGLCWGNNFQSMEARGCQEGYINFDFPGSGAHTENFCGVAYFNGKQFNSPTLVTMKNVPIYLNNAEGFTFGTLNIEWTRREGGGNWINLVNESTLSVGSLHFEGNELNNLTDSSIFNLSNSGGVRACVNVDNLHINNFTQTNGTFAIASWGGSSDGAVNIGSISGSPASNSFTDSRLVIANTGGAALSLGRNSGYSSYITQVKKGSLSSDFTPQVYIGGAAYESANLIQNPTATIDIGKASYMRLTGTQSASTTTIDFEALENERVRDLVIENDTGVSITFDTGGNLKTSSVIPFPITVSNNGILRLSLNINDNIANVISYS